MPSITLEGIFVGVGITLVGVLVGGFLGYYFSRKVAIEQIRLIAGAKLRAAFAQEISDYTLFKKQKISGLDMSGALLRHAPAVEEYRVFVPRKRREDYQKAWEYYDECFAENFRAGQPPQDNKNYIERIEAILKFAEPV